MIDAIWEEKYKNGFSQLYPWDSVVSFVFNYYPKHKEKKHIRILEVGFGTGSNLWFAAREGFNVFGIEGSPTAVEIAKSRFIKDKLSGDLRVGDFQSLPFDDNYFDMVIDRAALTHVGNKDQLIAIEEIYRVMNVNAYFYHNPYASNHTSNKHSTKGNDKTKFNISAGTLKNVGQVCFCSKNDIKVRFNSKWRIIDMKSKKIKGVLPGIEDIHSEWIVVAQKK